MDTSVTYVVCHHQMCILNTSFAYHVLIGYDNKKFQYPEFCMGYSDETWYVGSGGPKTYYPSGLSSPNVHIKYPHLYICSDWLIKKATLQSFALGILAVLGTSIIQVVYHH